MAEINKLGPNLYSIRNNGIEAVRVNTVGLRRILYAGQMRWILRLSSNRTFTEKLYTLPVGSTAFVLNDEIAYSDADLTIKIKESPLCIASSRTLREAIDAMFYSKTSGTSLDRLMFYANEDLVSHMDLDGKELDDGRGIEYVNNNFLYRLPYSAPSMPGAEIFLNGDDMTMGIAVKYCDASMCIDYTKGIREAFAAPIGWVEDVMYEFNREEH